MLTIKVEKLNQRKFKGKNGQEFINYSFASGGNWYQLAGKGKEMIKENDKIVGSVHVKEYTKSDGEKGTVNIFEIQDPVITELFRRIEQIEKKLDLKTSEAQNLETKPQQPETTQKLISDVDFKEKCQSYAKADRNKYDANLYEFGDGKYKSAREIPANERLSFLDFLRN